MAAKTVKYVGKKGWTYKMNNGMKAYVSAQRKKVEKEAPKRKHCPKCDRDLPVDAFGVRTHKDETGKPNRFSLQSYCTECRSVKGKSKAKKVVKKPAKKVAAAKKAAPKKAKAAKKVTMKKVATAKIEPGPEGLSALLDLTEPAPAPVAPAPAPVVVETAPVATTSPVLAGSLTDAVLGEGALDRMADAVLAEVMPATAPAAPTATKGGKKKLSVDYKA